MMEVTLTCQECGSEFIFIQMNKQLKSLVKVCETKNSVTFNSDHVDSVIKDCPKCGRKDFYQLKDFNRKIGVVLFVVAAILSIWTYGLSFVVLWIFDLILHKKLGNVVVCYKCNTLFRKVKNIEDIHGFDHEMNDRIVYADHDFKGSRRITKCSEIKVVVKNFK